VVEVFDLEKMERRKEKQTTRPPKQKVRILTLLTKKKD
jgi:hypothetical protein